MKTIDIQTFRSRLQKLQQMMAFSIKILQNKAVAVL